MHINNFAFILLVFGKQCMAMIACPSPLCTFKNTCIEDPSTCDVVTIKNCECLNGICDSSGSCICDDGFKMSEKSINRCEPHCTKDCVRYISFTICVLTI